MDAFTTFMQTHYCKGDGKRLDPPIMRLHLERAERYRGRCTETVETSHHTSGLACSGNPAAFPRLPVQAAHDIMSLSAAQWFLPSSVRLLARRFSFHIGFHTHLLPASVRLHTFVGRAAAGRRREQQRSRIKHMPCGRAHSNASLQVDIQVSRRGWS